MKWHSVKFILSVLILVITHTHAHAHRRTNTHTNTHGHTRTCWNPALTSSPAPLHTARVHNTKKPKERTMGHQRRLHSRPHSRLGAEPFHRKRFALPVYIKPRAFSICTYQIWPGRRPPSFWARVALNQRSTNTSRHCPTPELGNNSSALIAKETRDGAGLDWCSLSWVVCVRDCVRACLRACVRACILWENCVRRTCRRMYIYIYILLLLQLLLFGHR